MLGVSTLWKSQETDDGLVLLDQMLQIDLSRWELEYHITPKMAEQLRPRLRRHHIMVLSIHNFFPVPPGLPREQASGDAFLLSSPDREERDRAVKFTKRTMEFANDLEAPVVVLHLGRVDLEPETQTLRWYFQRDEITSPDAKEFLGEKLGEREEKKGKHLDAVLFSLDALHREAIRLDVLVGLENRYHYHEIPNADELAVIFEKFEGGNLRYWHDAGHAQVQENLGLVTQEELLRRYGPRLVGCHLHDVEGLDDHLPPGKGKLDFSRLKPYLTADTIKILEVHPGPTGQEMREAVETLKKVGLLEEGEV